MRQIFQMWNGSNMFPQLHMRLFAYAIFLEFSNACHCSKYFPRRKSVTKTINFEYETHAISIQSRRLLSSCLFVHERSTQFKDEQLLLQIFTPFFAIHNIYTSLFALQVYDKSTNLLRIAGDDAIPLHYVIIIGSTSLYSPHILYDVFLCSESILRSTAGQSIIEFILPSYRCERRIVYDIHGS